MKSRLVLSIVFFALAFVSYASEDNPPQNGEDFCFCPCRAPGDTEKAVIYPSQNCLALIDCVSDTDEIECSPEVLAFQENKPKELCFCPCRIPGCGPDVLYYPNQACLERIKCAYGQSECSAEYLGFSE